MRNKETTDPIRVLEEAAPHTFPGFEIDVESFDAAREYLNEDIELLKSE